MHEIDQIKKEHQELQSKVLEFQTLSSSPVEEYQKAMQKLTDIQNFWDGHEAKEERLFEKLRKNNVAFPVKKMGSEHKQLKGHLQAIQEMLKTGEEEKALIALKIDGQMFVDKLLEHITLEESLFEGIPKNV